MKSLNLKRIMCLALIATICGNLLNGCNNNVGGALAVRPISANRGSFNLANGGLIESTSATTVTTSEKRGILAEDDIAILVQSGQKVLRVIYLSAATGLIRLDTPAGLTLQIIDNPSLLKDFINRNLSQLTPQGVPPDNAQAVYYDSDEQVLHWLAFSENKTSWQEYALSVAAKDASPRLEQQQPLKASIVSNCNLALKACGLLRYQPTLVDEYIIDISYQTDKIVNEDGETQDGVIHERYLSGSAVRDHLLPAMVENNRSSPLPAVATSASHAPIEVSGEVKSSYNWTGEITPEERNFIYAFDNKAQLGNVAKPEPGFDWLPIVVPILVTALAGAGGGYLYARDKFKRDRSRRSEVKIELENGLKYRHLTRAGEDNIKIGVVDNLDPLPLKNLPLANKISFSEDGLFRIDNGKGKQVSLITLLTQNGSTDVVSAQVNKDILEEIKTEIELLNTDSCKIADHEKLILVVTKSKDTSEKKQLEHLANVVIPAYDDMDGYFSEDTKTYMRKVREILYNAPVRPWMKQLTELSFDFVMNMFENKYGINVLGSTNNWSGQGIPRNREQFEDYVSAVKTTFTSNYSFQTEVFHIIKEEHYFPNKNIANDMTKDDIENLKSDEQLSSGKKRFLDKMLERFNLNDEPSKVIPFAEFKQAYLDQVLGELNTIGVAYEMKSTTTKPMLVASLIGGGIGAGGSIGIKYFLFSGCGGYQCSKVDLFTSNESGEIRPINYLLGSILETKIPFTRDNQQYSVNVAQNFTHSCEQILEQSKTKSEDGIFVKDQDGTLRVISDINNQLCSIGRVARDKFISQELNN